MKKCMCLFILLSVLAFSQVKADIVMGQKTIMDVQITNLNDFPDVVIVSHDSSEIANGYTLKNVTSVNVIDDNKLNRPHLSRKPATFYVVNKKYLKKMGIDKVNWTDKKNVQKLNVEIAPQNATSDRYSAIEIELKLAKKNDLYYVYKSKYAAKLRTNTNQQANYDVIMNYKEAVKDPITPILLPGAVL